MSGMRFRSEVEMESDEKWLPVVGYEGYYEVSDHGRVRSVDRMVRSGATGSVWLAGRTLRPGTGRTGHLRVSLSREGRQTTHSVHALVLTAFIGRRPDEMEACHTNGDEKDNRLENLRWGTRSDNVLDQVLHGDHVNASKLVCQRCGGEYDRYTSPSGKTVRRCRSCENADARSRRQKKHEAMA